MCKTGLLGDTGLFRGAEVTLNRALSRDRQPRNTGLIPATLFLQLLVQWWRHRLSSQERSFRSSERLQANQTPRRVNTFPHSRGRSNHQSVKKKHVLNITAIPPSLIRKWARNTWQVNSPSSVYGGSAPDRSFLARAAPALRDRREKSLPLFPFSIFVA